jgi:hypothetical protein
MLFVHTRVFITPEDVSDKVTAINDVIPTKANSRGAANPTLPNVIVNIWMSFKQINQPDA